MDTDLSLTSWPRASRVLDFIMTNKPNRAIKESPGSYGIKGESEKPRRKPRKPKEEPQAEPLRMF